MLKEKALEMAQAGIKAYCYNTTDIYSYVGITAVIALLVGLAIGIMTRKK